MNRKPHVLNTRGLIAAAVAMASGSVLAEQAGRVSFVTGEVKATAADGSVRSLARGDIINGGDKISTGSGRLQLRFTDGGFVSLQPNTVFGVDQYLYANKPPEETSLFFSLLQGGMRTITGAIGKVNKQSYKVRTPVATIGIRGTEYRARVDQKRLVVSVGSGFVNVANERGQITGGAGQNIQALLDSAPGYTTDEPDINATGPEGEREQEVAEDTENSRQQRQAEQLLADGNNEELANLLNPDGTPHPVPTYVDIESSLPNGSNYSITLTGDSGPTTLSGLTATFDPSTGAITSLVLPSGGEIAPPLGQLTAAEVTPVVTGATFRPGTLKFVNAARYGNIGFGEITDGVAEINDFEGLLPSSVGSDEFYTYMMAVPMSSYMGGMARYSLQGGTLARVNRSSDSGTLDHFNLNLNLLTGRADVDMLVKMTNSSMGDISVAGNGLSLNRESNTFFLGSGLSTTSTGSFCASNSCSTAISGMFVGSKGSQVAASYTISSYMNSGSVITGYAALGKSKSVAEQVGDFAILMPNGEDYSYANIIRDADGRLLSFVGDDCDDGCDTYFDSGSLKFTNIGHSGSIYWGEYTDGQGTFFYGTSGAGEGAILNAGEFQAYIVGPQVSPTFSGTAHYSLHDSSMAPRLNGGTTKGTLNRFNLDINLGTARASVDLQVTLAGEILNANQSNLYLSSFNGSKFNLNGISTSSTGNFCGSGSCYTYISGFFSGNDGSQLGASYYISGASSAIAGVAALGRDSIEPDPAVTHNLSLLTVGAGEGDGQGYAGVIAANFNPDGSVFSITHEDYCEGSYCAEFTPGQLHTVNQGQTSLLKWGEFTGDEGGSYAESSDIYGLPYYLDNTRFVSYIIGATDDTADPIFAGNATASYTMSAGHATPARVTDGNGTSQASLDSFTMTLNLFSGRLDELHMQISNVGSLAETVTVSGNNLTLPVVLLGRDISGAAYNDYAGSLYIPSYAGLVVTSSQQDTSGGFCYEATCGAAFRFFFAGNGSELGASYWITGNGTIGGVAALDLTDSISALDNPFKTDTGYTLLATNSTNNYLFNNQSAIGGFDASGNLQSLVYSPSLLVGPTIYLDQGDTTHVDTGTYKTLHWGRLSGAGQSATLDNQSLLLGATESVDSIHYVVGTIMDDDSWGSLNNTFDGYTATYKVQGGTNPTRTGNGLSETGTLDASPTETYIALHLGANPTLDVALKATVGGDVYRASQTGASAGTTFSLSNMATTVNNSACGGSGCSTSVNGFFAGSQAEQVGMTYSILDQRTATMTVNGAVAFTSKSIAPAGQ